MFRFVFDTRFGYQKYLKQFQFIKKETCQGVQIIDRPICCPGSVRYPLP